MLLYDALQDSLFNQAGILKSNGDFYLASYEEGVMFYFKQKRGKKMTSFAPPEDLLSGSEWRTIAPKS